MTAVTPATTNRRTLSRRARWIFRSLILLGLLVLGFLLISAYLYSSTPAFYAPVKLSPQQTAAAAEVAEEKLISLRNWAEHTHSIESARLRGHQAPSIGPITVTASDAQINAFFHKWKSLIDWDGKYDRYVSNPTVAIAGGHVMLFGHVNSLHTVLSLIFDLNLDTDGQLRVKLDQVRAGRLAMPGLLWDGQLARVTRAIQKMLPRWQKEARMDATGATNLAGVALAMSHDLLAIVDNRPVPPVIFVPVSPSRAIPARISAVSVGIGKITLTLHAMSATERESYWQSQTRRARHDSQSLR